METGTTRARCADCGVYVGRRHSADCSQSGRLEVAKLENTPPEMRGHAGEHALQREIKDGEGRVVKSNYGAPQEMQSVMSKDGLQALYDLLNVVERQLLDCQRRQDVAVETIAACVDQRKQLEARRDGLKADILRGERPLYAVTGAPPTTPSPGWGPSKAGSGYPGNNEA